MTLARTLARLLGVGAAMATIAAPAVIARPAHAQGAHGGLTPPSVPAALRVPMGNTAYLVGHATGVQIYTCEPTGAGFGWSPATPAALLLTNDGNDGNDRSAARPRRSPWRQIRAPIHPRYVRRQTVPRRS